MGPLQHRCDEVCASWLLGHFSALIYLAVWTESKVLLAEPHYFHKLSDAPETESLFSHLTDPALTCLLYDYSKMAFLPTAAFLAFSSCTSQDNTTSDCQLCMNVVFFYKVQVTHQLPYDSFFASGLNSNLP